jgi:hypothetical protein
MRFSLLFQLPAGLSNISVFLTVNRLAACMLAVPAAMLLILSLSIVENRIQTMQLHDKRIVQVRTELENLRKVQSNGEEAKKEIADRQDFLSKEQDEQASVANQVIWGSEEARKSYAANKDRSWANLFHQNSSDHNLMIAAMAAATLACLLSVIVIGTGNAVYAVGAGLIIGLFAVVAAKGAKAFLLSGAGASQAGELDPYSIVLIAFLAGAYQNRLLDLMQTLVQGRLTAWGVIKPDASTPDIVKAHPADQSSHSIPERDGQAHHDLSQDEVSRTADRSGGLKAS